MKALLFSTGILTALLLAGLFALAYHPPKVYSFSPQVFPTGIEVDESVNSAGSGLKHGRLTTHCLTTGGCSEQINWPGTSFLDTNYTVVCSSSNTQATATPTGKSTTAVFVFLTTTTRIITPIEIDCIAMHD